MQSLHVLQSQGFPFSIKIDSYKCLHVLQSVCYTNDISEEL